MKYKLLKETPFDKSGAELFLYEAWGNYASQNSYLVDGKSYPKDVVENNPEWFCPIDSTCGKCGESGIDDSIDVRYEEDVIKAFNKFIKKWCGKWYPHLIDDDENDGQFMREKIEALLPKSQPKEEKCGEREGIELCPKCGAESYGNCPCKPKEEKIEQVVLNNIGEIDSEDDVDDFMLIEKINLLIRNQKAIINKLNGDN